MRPSQPRIPPLEEEAFSSVIEELIESRGLDRSTVPNIVRTFGRYPELYRAWVTFGHHVLAESSLPPRARELLILRTASCCASDYEFAHHVVMARAAGMTEAEITRVAEPGLSSEWDDADRNLLEAAGELLSTHCIRDDTWSNLTTRWTEPQVMDIVFTVGQYALAAMALNSFGVQLEPPLRPSAS
jgi:alkylhydroperoxidase family enzyme